jgi:hypothetical protein
VGFFPFFLLLPTLPTCPRAQAEMSDGLGHLPREGLPADGYALEAQGGKILSGAVERWGLPNFVPLRAGPSRPSPGCAHRFDRDHFRLAACGPRCKRTVFS